VSDVEAGRQGLVEAEVGLGLRVRRIEGGGLIEQEVTLWRAARGGEGRGTVREVEMRRMADTTGGSVRKARMDIWPPQAGQSRGRTS
jgi:hypothetical protein